MVFNKQSRTVILVNANVKFGTLCIDANTNRPSKNNIGAARTPKSGEIVINTMRYRRIDTVKRLVDFPIPTLNIPTKLNFLHLPVSEIESGEDFKGQGHYRKVKGQIKATS